tara:strand:- start:1299 stop:1907 length:609 start_codon:yes stop_codon:yes gene_type:complete
MGTVKDDVEVYDPVNTNKNVYYSKIMYKNAEISLQIPKNTLTLNKEKQKAKLIIDEATSNFIREVSRAVIEITSCKSQNFFGKEISVEDCEIIYKEAAVNNVLHCFYDEDTFFYISKKDSVSVDDLPVENEGIALLKCSAVVYTKHSFFIRWEISQFKIKKNKLQEEEVFTLEEYAIKDLPDHDLPIYGDPLVKKLDEICLF